MVEVCEYVLSTVYFYDSAHYGIIAHILTR